MDGEYKKMLGSFLVETVRYPYQEKDDGVVHLFLLRDYCIAKWDTDRFEAVAWAIDIDKEFTKRVMAEVWDNIISRACAKCSVKEW